MSTKKATQKKKETRGRRSKKEMLKDMTPLQAGLLYKEDRDKRGMSPKDMAIKYDVPQVTIYRYLQLADAHPEVHKLVEKDKISSSKVLDFISENAKAKNKDEKVLENALAHVEEKSQKKASKQTTKKADSPSKPETPKAKEKTSTSRRGRKSQSLDERIQSLAQGIEKKGLNSNTAQLIKEAAIQLHEGKSTSSILKRIEDATKEEEKTSNLVINFNTLKEQISKNSVKTERAKFFNSLAKKLSKKTAPESMVKMVS